jgi:hypothetical protein
MSGPWIPVLLNAGVICWFLKSRIADSKKNTELDQLPIKLVMEKEFSGLSCVYTVLSCGIGKEKYIFSI